MDLPKITIVTVTYNLIKDGRKEFFKQCCESVANQTYPNIEHLIIDGASTDGTLELIEECRHPRMRVISEPDEGCWEAMNNAIYYAKGDYLQYLNSDDCLYQNDVIEKAMKNLIETGADASVAHYKLRNRDDSIINDFNENIAPLKRELFWKIFFYNHETLICKVDIYKKLGAHDLKYKTAVDYYWSLQLVLNSCNICTLEDIMIYARTGGLSYDAEGSIPDYTIFNFYNIVKDTWNFYPLTYDECKKMVLSLTYPHKFLKGLQNHINALNLKNFDYKYFNEDIESFMKNQFKKVIIQNKVTKELLKILSILNIIKYRNKYKRLNYYLDRHPKQYEILKNLALFLSRGGGT